MSEKPIEDKYVEYAQSRGCLALKLVVLSMMGFPDRTTFCPGGKVFFIEFKYKNNKPSPMQRKYKKWLTKLGFNWYCINNLEEAKKVLDENLEASD